MMNLITLLGILITPMINDSGNTFMFNKSGSDNGHVTQSDTGGQHLLMSKNALFQAKVTASDGEEVDRFGLAVSQSGDFVFVGAPNDIVNNITNGSVYVYEYDGVTWQETQHLSSGGRFDLFGNVISASGNQLMITAHQASMVGGSVYVYEFDGSEWQSRQHLMRATGGGVREGIGDSISLVGDRALIGAVDTESVYVFEFDGQLWERTQILTNNHISGYELFGYSVSLMGDHAFVGTPKDDNGSGSVFVFEYDGNNWIETQKLTARDAANTEGFGGSIENNGTQVLIGASATNPAAYVFEFDGNQWTEIQKLSVIDEGASGWHHLHTPVGINNNQAILAAISDTSVGSVYLFEYDGNSWRQTQKIFAQNGPASLFFGGAISLSAERIIIGANNDDENGTASGSAYIYELSANRGAVTPVPVNGKLALLFLASLLMLVVIRVNKTMG